MPALRPLPLAALLAALLAGCTSTVGTTGGGGTVVVGSAEDSQLRASVARELRRYGISDACVQSLDRAALGQIRAFTSGPSPRSSREWIIERQQVRTFVGRYCPNL